MENTQHNDLTNDDNDDANNYTVVKRNNRKNRQRFTKIPVVVDNTDESEIIMTVDDSDSNEKKIVLIDEIDSRQELKKLQGENEKKSPNITEELLFIIDQVEQKEDIDMSDDLMNSKTDRTTGNEQRQKCENNDQTKNNRHHEDNNAMAFHDTTIGGCCSTALTTDPKSQQQVPGVIYETVRSTLPKSKNAMTEQELAKMGKTAKKELVRVSSWSDRKQQQEIKKKSPNVKQLAKQFDETTSASQTTDKHKHKQVHSLTARSMSREFREGLKSNVSRNFNRPDNNDDVVLSESNNEVELDHDQQHSTITSDDSENISPICCNLPSIHKLNEPDVQIWKDIPTANDHQHYN